MDRQYQNLTIPFPKETLRKAKIIAATKDTSVSAIVRELLARYVAEHDAYDQAREKYFSILREGSDMGTLGKATWRRDELHER